MIYIETPQELKRAIELRIETLKNEVGKARTHKRMQILGAEIYGLRYAIELVDDHIATLAKKAKEPFAVEVRPPQHVVEQIAMEMEGEYVADELRFVIYNDTDKGKWITSPEGKVQP